MLKFFQGQIVVLFPCDIQLCQEKNSNELEIILFTYFELLKENFAILLCDIYVSTALVKKNPSSYTCFKEQEISLTIAWELQNDVIFILVCGFILELKIDANTICFESTVFVLHLSLKIVIRSVENLITVQQDSSEYLRYI